MKHELKITEDNYREVVLKRSIILCWVLLAICFVIKIFGGNFFAIVCKNERFIKICEFVDKYYISILFQFIHFTVTSWLIIKCVNLKPEKQKIIIISVILFIYWIFKVLMFLDIFVLNLVIYDILDFIVLYVCCIISYNKETKLCFKTLLKPVIFITLLFIFSLVSAIVKSIGYKGTVNDSFLMASIFMIDYYIMIVLNYLYQKRR